MKQKIYCIDSSSFIRLHQMYPRDILPEIWEIMEAKFDDNFIVSHKFVFDELNPTASVDNLGKWVGQRQKHFFPVTATQIQYVSDIVKNFPKLIDSNMEKDQADPWIIALAKELQNNDDQSLFPIEYIVMSEESKDSTYRIPAVCKSLNLQHISLLDFYRKYKK